MRWTQDDSASSASSDQYLPHSPAVAVSPVALQSGWAGRVPPPIIRGWADGRQRGEEREGVERDVGRGDGWVVEESWRELKGDFLVG